jgi:hypothetical protein
VKKCSSKSRKGFLFFPSNNLIEWFDEGHVVQWNQVSLSAWFAARTIATKDLNSLQRQMKNYQFQDYLNSNGLQHVKFSTYCAQMDSCGKKIWKHNRSKARGAPCKIYGMIQVHCYLFNLSWNIKERGDYFVKMFGFQNPNPFLAYSLSAHLPFLFVPYPRPPWLGSLSCESQCSFILSTGTNTQQPPPSS